MVLGFIGHRRGCHAKILKIWALRRRDFPDRVHFGHGQRWKTALPYGPGASVEEEVGAAMSVRERERIR